MTFAAEVVDPIIAVPLDDVAFKVVDQMLNLPKQLTFELSNKTIRDNFDFASGLSEPIDINSTESLIMSEIKLTNLSFQNID